jgi:hypothetical protein
MYLREQCRHSGYGLFKGELCHRKPGCLFTWEVFSTVPKFLRTLTALHVEADLLRNLRSAGAFYYGFGILNPGSALDIFPKLTYKSYWWKFQDGKVYDCQRGVLMDGKDLLDPFVSCEAYHDSSFDPLPGKEPGKGHLL